MHKSLRTGVKSLAHGRIVDIPLDLVFTLIHVPASDLLYTPFLEQNE